MRLGPIAMVIGLALISAPPSLAGEDNEAVFVNLGTIGSFAESGGADATGRTGARRAPGSNPKESGIRPRLDGASSTATWLIIRLLQAHRLFCITAAS